MHLSNSLRRLSLEGGLILTLLRADTSLTPYVPAETYTRCSRCEGWRFTTSLEDEMCQACHREMTKLNLYQVEEDGMIPISIKMYYDHFRWHFEKEIRDKVRGTRLVFTPFSVAALHAFREYMMVVNPALYIPLPKQTAGKRGGNRIVWRIVIEDPVHFSTAMCNSGRDRFYQGLTGVLRSDAYLAWIPPLSLVVTVNRKGDKEFGACVISAGAARLTSYGFSFAPRIPRPPLLDQITKFLALAVFGLQQERADENVRRQGGEAPPLQMITHPLLITAHQYAQ